MHHPIQFGNIVLILVGILLTLSGPYITYRTILGIKKNRLDPQMKVLTVGQRVSAGFSNGLNFLIAVIFFLAGILFIVNNLKGNPLA